MEIVSVKHCGVCNKDLSVVDFRKDKSHSDGLSSKCRNCANAWHREYRKQNPGLRETYVPSKYDRHGSHIKNKYKISKEDYSAMLAEQFGGCAVCGRTVPGGRGSFHIDHDHSTGGIRGLLCAPCNMGIGMLGDNSAGIRLALNYLERPQNRLITGMTGNIFSAPAAASRKAKGRDKTEGI